MLVAFKNVQCARMILRCLWEMDEAEKLLLRNFRIEVILKTFKHW